MTIKNNLMTSKTIKLTIVATMFVIIGTAMTFENAYAAHPLPTFYPFSSGNQSVCYQTTALNSVKVNGSTGQSTLLKSKTELARIHVDSNTDITISFDSVCNSGDDQVSAKYISSSSIHAETQVFNAGTSSMYKIIWYTTNSGHNFSISSICTAGQDANPQFVANHEFGHFAGLNHPTFELLVPAGHTMMKSFCSNDYASIKTDDKNQINGFY